MKMTLSSLALLVCLLAPNRAVATPPPEIPGWAEAAGKSTRTLCLLGGKTYADRVEWCATLEEWGLKGTFRLCMAAGASGQVAWAQYCKRWFS
jgi:hypothetical protein